jgi:regulator of protease activity HflC (stomatin/prohibitin superfamily)
MISTGTIVLLSSLLLLLFLSIVIVQKGTIAITAIFGKFSRILRPGLNFRILSSVEGMQKTMKDMMALDQLKNKN